MKTLIRGLSMFGAILALPVCGEGGGGGDGAGSAATPIPTPVFARYAYAANSFNGVVGNTASQYTINANNNVKNFHLKSPSVSNPNPLPWYCPHEEKTDLWMGERKNFFPWSN